MVEKDCDNWKSNWKFGSNINEVIRAVLNFLFLFFFYEKILHAQKAQKE